MRDGALVPPHAAQDFDPAVSTEVSGRGLALPPRRNSRGCGGEIQVTSEPVRGPAFAPYFRRTGACGASGNNLLAPGVENISALLINPVQAEFAYAGQLLVRLTFGQQLENFSFGPGEQLIRILDVPLSPGIGVLVEQVR